MILNQNQRWVYREHLKGNESTMGSMVQLKISWLKLWREMGRQFWQTVTKTLLLAWITGLLIVYLTGYQTFLE